MCERTYCRHEHERLCSCPPVTCRDALGMAAHLAENMEKVQWSLTYNSLKDIKPYQLCLVGKCRICGGRLCMEQRPVEADSTDGFLAAVYRHLYHFHRSIGQDLPRAAFRTKFVEMFRKEDRAAVEDWLSRLENQSIHAMICGNAKRVYTIVHSWADADQGNFPAPEGMAAFTVKEEARKELARLVAEEKENRTIPFPTEEYCEEYGEDFWEAYRTAMPPDGLPAMRSSKVRCTQKISKKKEVRLMMLRKPNCSDCPHNLQYMESLPIKKKGVTMHLGERFCVAGKRARKFKRSDPKTYVPSWCPRLKAPCELRIYGFKNQREWRMHRSMRAYLGEDTSPSAFRYAVRYEGHTDLAPYEFFECCNEKSDDEILGAAVQHYDVVEIDDGIKPAFFYKTEHGYELLFSFDAKTAKKNIREEID